MLASPTHASKKKHLKSTQNKIINILHSRPIETNPDTSQTQNLQNNSS